MGGNVRVDDLTRGIHDPLHATIVVIESGAEARVLVGLDLVSAPSTLVDAISSQIERRTGISAMSVFVSATHTHSGPDVMQGGGFVERDYSAVDAWREASVPAIAEAAAVAQANAVPASLRYGSTDAMHLSFNRRLAHSDGTTHMNWEALEPDDVIAELGPVDNELLVMTFSNERGAPLGTLVHFTLHPAILVGHDWLISADFIAETSDAISSSLNGTPVLFLNGALGNINHIDYRDAGRAIGFNESDRVGRSLGQAAVGVLDRETIELDLDSVETRILPVTLAQRTVGREQLENARRILDANAGLAIEALDGIPKEAYALWTIGVGRRLAPLLSIEVSVVRLDKVVFVYVPFEVFVEFGLEIRKAFPNHVVRVVSIGGGYYGYLPTAKAFAEGGYEPTMGTSTIECGQGEYLFHEITKMLRSIL
jgi:hypothetical protein